MSKRLYLLLSPHRGAACLEFFNINNLLWPMHPGIPRAMPLLMLLKPRRHIVRVSSIVTSVIAEKQIDIVGCRSLLPIAHLVRFSQAPLLVFLLRL